MKEISVDEDVTRELAERIRPELGSLLEPEDLEQFETELDALLARGAQGEEVSLLIGRLMNSTPRVSGRYAELLNFTSRTMQLPPGRRGLPLPPRYVCPAGDYWYFQIDVAKPVPPCPHDGSTLVLDDGSAV
jgi:hypothetical protein